jgi:hypothetical protein
VDVGLVDQAFDFVNSAFTVDRFYAESALKKVDCIGHRPAATFDIRRRSAFEVLSVLEPRRLQA